MRPARLLGNMGFQKLTRYPHITTRPGWDVGLDSDRIDLWPWFAQSREAYRAISAVQTLANTRLTLNRVAAFR